MSRFGSKQLTALISIAAASTCTSDENTLSIPVDGEPLIHYQAKPLDAPRGGDRFKGSDFIHPLRTPSGFAVTDMQPSDHPHHFGLWWPWKYIGVDGRHVLFWELQEGDGIVEAMDASLTLSGWTASSVYIDRKADGGPKPLIREILNAEVSPIRDDPAHGYCLDLEIIHCSLTPGPLTVEAYRYSGFTLRGAPSWNHATSTILTSEGEDRETSNFTRAKWVRVEGEAGMGGTAGILLMSHPDNHNHPEHVRTWNATMDDGAVFINFNPVQKDPWIMEPGREYIRRYRVFVYDGAITAHEAEELWSEYSRIAQSDSTVHD